MGIYQVPAGSSYSATVPLVEGLDGAQVAVAWQPGPASSVTCTITGVTSSTTYASGTLSSANPSLSCLVPLSAADSAVTVALSGSNVAGQISIVASAYNYSGNPSSGGGGGGGSGYTAAPITTVTGNVTLTNASAPNIYPVLLEASANITAPRAPSSQADRLFYYLTQDGTGGRVPTLLDASGNPVVTVDGEVVSWASAAGYTTVVEFYPNEAGTNWVVRYTTTQGVGFLLAANNLSDVANAAASRSNLGAAAAGITENQQGAGYTFALSDATFPTEVQSTGSSAQSFTIPPNSSVAFPVGAVLVARQLGSGALTVVAGGGVTLHGAGTFAQFTPSHRFTQTAPNVWCED